VHPVTIDISNGNPLELKYFITTFEEVVETKIADGKGRLTRLIQFTSGEAKDKQRNTYKTIW